MSKLDNANVGLEMYINRISGTPLSDVAERLRLPEKLVKLLVRDCVYLTCRAGVVVFDKMVDDPDYGTIYRKEVFQLRRDGVPTLKEIAERCAAVRRRHMAKRAAK